MKRYLLVFVLLLASVGTALADANTRLDFDTYGYVYTGTSTYAVTSATAARMTGYTVSCVGSCQMNVNTGLPGGTPILQIGTGNGGTNSRSGAELGKCGGKPGLCFPQGIYISDTSSPGVTAPTATIFWEYLNP